MKSCKPNNKTKPTQITHLNRSSKTKKMDVVVCEVPLTIVLNGIEIAIVLCSPEKLDFLVAGYLLSEAFITRDTKLEQIDINEKNWQAQVKATGGTISLDSSSRTRLVTSGCANVLPVYRAVDAQNYQPLTTDIKISSDKILELMKKFQERSITFRETGGVHACALCDKNDIQCFAEDIGRHNAVDKIIGEYFLQNRPIHESMILTTGRVSSEILLKLLKAGIPIIVSRSAPTSLALEIAQKSGITLVGFARGARMNIYCGDSRIQINGKPTRPRS